MPNLAPALAARPPGASELDGRVRAVVENVTPSVDGGRFAVKRIVGDRVVVEADCFADGHDVLAVNLLWRREDDADWNSLPMVTVGNDRWRGVFAPDAVGNYRYTVMAWVDRFLSWRHDFERRVDEADLRLALRAGAQLAVQAAERASGDAAARLTDWAVQLNRAAQSEPATAQLRELALAADMAELMMRYPDQRYAFTHPVEFPLVVDRERALFSAWYEFFPRSAAQSPERHGTFRDCEAMLPYVADMGFDIVYFPPIHPIGRVNRKGRNNTLVTVADDVGSPWAIGAEEGGHKSVHPPLGTLADFERLVARARDLGMEIALDLAYQCAPDHPYVKEHPAWFRWRPDGTVQYAENPPKKYQDIYPFDFESDDWQALWRELADVIDFWIGRGVKIFRVDNPHTKAFPFWEWTIATVKARHPDVLFLSEAFTRPKVMHRLAKLGFSQSYTYFAWRNTKRELTDYFTELAHGPGRDYFRPNAWPNTPDILTEYLQLGGRPAFMSRLVLAATLSASYGIYGPAYEHIEATAREPGSEEYLHSEKYELKARDLKRGDSLAAFISRVNHVRRDNPALHANESLRFLTVDNEQLIAYAKSTPALDNVVICLVNLDPHHVQSGWLQIDLAALGLAPDAPFQVHELLTDARYLWHGERNYVSLDPQRVPAHVFRLRRRVRREQDFDYFM
ncbi:MAG: alpha-1,4-glucan--maltose-1-phosphate maltosyltransferase [Gemmatimonadota bacterium]